MKMLKKRKETNLDEFKAKISDTYLKSYRANFSAVDLDSNYYHWNPNPFYINYYEKK